MRPRHFPDFIATYLEYTSGHEGTPRCQMWSIISVIAASMGRKVWLDRGFYTLYPNLYVFIIGKSGMVKKSTTTGIAVDLYRELPDNRMMSERLTAASLIKQLTMSGTSFAYGDKKIRQSAIFSYASELSVFMSEVSGSITELLTTFYDCQPNDSNKPWVNATKGEGDTKIYGPCLNILGASTRTWLKKCVPASEMEGGFSSRVTFVVENEGPKTFVAWPKVNPGLRDIRTKLVEDLEIIQSLIGEVEVSPRATELFEKWYQYHMKHIVPENSDPRMTGYFARKGDLALKLAMIRVVSRGNVLRMEAEDLVWAVQEIDKLEPDMRGCFDSVSSNPATEITYDIMSYIRNRGRVEKAEIKRAFANVATGFDVDRSLTDLVGMDEIDVAEEKQPSGNPRQFFSPRAPRATL